MSRRYNIPIDLDDLRKRYLEGVPEYVLAEEYGVSRSVTSRHLRAMGITRTNSECMKLRMGNATLKQRQAWAAGANRARRAKGASPGELARKAAKRQRTLSKVGGGEVLFADWLREREVSTIPQLAIGGYNIDIACWPVAVEIHVQSNNPRRDSALLKRSKYILDAGWSQIYVWINAGYFLSPNAADEVVAYLERAKRFPPGAREYRVIRGTGELVTSLRFNPGQTAFIPRAEPFEGHRARH